MCSDQIPDLAKIMQDSIKRKEMKDLVQMFDKVITNNQEAHSFLMEVSEKSFSLIEEQLELGNWTHYKLKLI
jgi:hypothetical protein